ncbi:MAG: hypothetical protein RDV48_25730 [Candidatus Eremiobacteraeota bacterium]|nr:hypothetical protein [Candidatus Eremiobacteraeota bacterium]
MCTGTSVKIAVIIALAAFLFINGCQGKPATDHNSASSPAGSSSPATPAPVSETGAEPDTSTPEGEIAYQMTLIKKGDTEKLKECFTPRLKDRITGDMVKQAQGEVGRYTIKELVDSFEISTHGGKETAKIKMKNGRTLTTLVKNGDRWQADTIWFK